VGGLAIADGFADGFIDELVDDASFANFFAFSTFL
jgi:hypothetical protein